jgi:serine/threonine-protein kinase
MDQAEATPVAGTEGGISPFLSPDDRWIGFWEGGKLKKVPVGGGVPVFIYDKHDDAAGADWGSDNRIVFSSWDHLCRISAEGGETEILTERDPAKGEDCHLLPHFLPDGRGVLFTIAKNIFDIQPHLAILDLKTKKWRVVMEDAADGRYVRTGHIVFMRQGTLMAVAFDLDRLEVRGKPVPVVENVMQALNIPNGTYNQGAGQYGVSDSGWLVYASGGMTPDRVNSIVRVDQKGNVRPVIDTKGPFVYGRFSPDGRKIAYQTMGSAWRLFVYDIDRGTVSALTTDGCVEYEAWTPDGKHLVFGWFRSGEPNLYMQAADGSTPMERLTTSDDYQVPGSFSPDGSILAFVELNPKTGWSIFLLDMKSHRVTPFLNPESTGEFPEFSPDGHWLAYASSESGNVEVWVRPFPGPGGRWQISKEGGTEPIWSKDGRQLFYRHGDQVWVADVRTEGGFAPGKPRLLFQQRGSMPAEPVRSWDLWPDGQAFLMFPLDERKPQPVMEISVVQNWFEELKRLVPAGKK